MKKLTEDLTIIITSSAIPSFKNLVGLSNSVSIVLVFDGFKEIEKSEKVKFKSMRIHKEHIERYDLFKKKIINMITRLYLCENVNQLKDETGLEDVDADEKDLEYFPEIKIIEKFVKSSYGVRIGKTLNSSVEILNFFQKNLKIKLKVLILERRFGFALAVREALKLVETKYILILQHDYAFIEEVDLEILLKCMEFDNELKYIGFNSLKSISKVRLNLPPPYYKEIFGMKFESLFFWYDKPHLSTKDHYETFVFNTGRFQVGNFIEDVLGHSLLKELRDNGILAHTKYGCFSLLVENFTLKHINGRQFREEIVMGNGRGIKKG
ncbi:hypothetical protein HDU92_000245 [Lobulomyces angularis]|nr:hypothetical protein HDU92_000245 [Lobulomyces angularis]